MTRTEAVKFLSFKNNYLRIASYRINFPQHNGKYYYLDFKHLVELSTLDMHFRTLIMKMSISIEHCLKVNLIHDLEYNNAEDGYSIVNSFVNIPGNEYILKDIKRKSTSQYNGDLINHYFNFSSLGQSNNTNMNIDCPAWVLVEAISFGTFINFYNHYYSCYPSKNAVTTSKLLNSVRSLRNACAHNNCILHDLKPGSTIPNIKIVNVINSISGISKNQRQARLSNRFTYEFVSVLYLFDLVVSDEVKKHMYIELNDFSKRRLLRHIDYFSPQTPVKNSIEFLSKAIDFFSN